MKFPTLDRILFAGTYADKNYAAYLKGCVSSATVATIFAPIKTKYELKMLCDKHKITQVLTTSTVLLEKFLAWDERKKPLLSNYAGSYFTIDNIEVVFIPPLQQLITVPYGKFLTTRFCEKFTKKDQWLKTTKFHWELLKETNIEQCYDLCSRANLIAVDIETIKENLAIRCIGYTAVYFTNDTIETQSFVLPLTSMWAVAWMRKFNSLPAGKILQNGKYDISYLCRYNSPLINYAWDTQYMFHAQLSELPKDLGFLNSFYQREAMYWKDQAHTTDLMEYYEYNALDTWATANTFIAMIYELPNYAVTNYALEFPLVFPCHLAEMTGIKRDMDKLEIARTEQDALIAENTASLNKMLKLDNFNTNSPTQVKQLMHMLGCKDLKSADEKNIEKARFRHPLNARILQHVIDNRKARKAATTYLTTGDKAKELQGRILYSLNPSGTDTGRLASRAHHFWCGFNIQNQTRGKLIKQTYVADKDFYFAECDLSQAEAWDIAYLSGDKSLIDAVSSDRDFHAVNANRFFGVPYKLIFDDATRKTLDKELRDLSKRVNHGTAYNMMWFTLLGVMGEKKVVRAKHLLELPRLWGMRQVCEHLLELYHTIYPGVRKTYYAGMIDEVCTTGYLKSWAIHHSKVIDLKTAEDNYDEWYDNCSIGSWTRRCFGNPGKPGHQRNSLIAHGPQSLSAATLNKAWLKIFFDIAIHPEHRENFKLCAQIHDSILYQWRRDCEYLHEMVRKRMEIPVTIRGYDNVVRTFTVPADVKAGKDGKPVKYWSETE